MQIQNLIYLHACEVTVLLTNLTTSGFFMYVMGNSYIQVYHLYTLVLS